MGIEKVRKDDTARTFEFLFRFNRVWINGRLLLLLLLLNQLGSKAASESTFKKSNTCGVSNNRLYFTLLTLNVGYHGQGF